MATVFDTLAAELREIGLGVLFDAGNGTTGPSGWLWDQIQGGLETSEQLGIALEQTDIFKDRFGVIVEQKKRAAAGQPGPIMTPGEVLAYEKTVKEYMHGAGIPTWFYDEPGDFTGYILNNISPAEIKRKLDNTFEYVANAAPEVRQMFSEYYGVGQGDAALAAYVLDPDRAAARLEKSQFTAYVGGMARKYGLELGKASAERLADLPMGEAGVVEGVRSISQQADLFNETRFEDTNLTAEGEGIDATFMGSNAAQTAISRRQAERSALRGVSTGGAVVTNKGLVGARTAEGR
jgi:hypothetical protein